MTYPVRYLVLVPLVSALLMMAAIVEASAGDAPVLVKGKFETPVNFDEVADDWKARGYSNWSRSSKERGWSSTRPHRQHRIERRALRARRWLVWSCESSRSRKGDRAERSPGRPARYSVFRSRDHARLLRSFDTQQVPSFTR